MAEATLTFGFTYEDLRERGPLNVGSRTTGAEMLPHLMRLLSPAHGDLLAAVVSRFVIPESGVDVEIERNIQYMAYDVRVRIRGPLIASVATAPARPTVGWPFPPFSVLASDPPKAEQPAPMPRERRMRLGRKA